MRHILLAGLVVGLSLGLAVAMLAEEVPWKKTDAAAPADAATAPATAPATTDPPAAGTKNDAGTATTTTTAAPAVATDATSLAKDPKFATVVKPIEEQIAQVAKIQALYDKEMAKPEKSRNLQLLDGYKTSMARAYLAGSLKAKAAAAQFAKDEDKKLLADTYEKPLRDKALAIILELADAALAKKDYRNATSLYQQCLQIDKDCQAATDALKQIQEAMKQPATTTSTTTGAGGGSSSKDPPKSWQQPNYSNPGYTKSWKTTY
jgi:tetratricopeptide (TPR) repeat protein